ncbi:MAG: hypothetical protein HYY17_11800 [Planctomycetes bacterium]|nr:hypothetical protein [Planctomycetota bacterium]
MRSVGEGKASGAAGHVPAAAVGVLVLLAAAVGRTDPPRIRPSARRTAPAPDVSAQAPVRADGSSTRAGGERADETTFEASGPRAAPMAERAKALKAAFQRRSEASYLMAARVLCDEQAEFPLRDYALRLLRERAASDVRARSALATCVRNGVHDRDRRASAVAALLRSAGDDEIAGWSGIFLAETDGDVVVSAIRALTGNGSPAATDLAASLAAHHPDPAVRRKLEDADSDASSANTAE